VWSLLSELAHLSRLTSLTADVLRDRSGLRQLARSAPGLSGLLALSLTVRKRAGNAGANSPALAAADLLFLSQLSALRALTIYGASVRPTALPSLHFLTHLDIPKMSMNRDILSKLPAGLQDASFGDWSGGGDGGGGGGGAGGGDGPPAPPPCASITCLACSSTPNNLKSLISAFPSVVSACLLIFHEDVFYPPSKPTAGWWLRSLDLERHSSAAHLSPATLMRLLGDMSGLMELRVSTDGGCVDLGALLAAAPQLLRLALETGALTSVDLATSPALPRLPRLKWLYSAAGLSVRGLLALGRAAPGLTRLRLGNEEAVERALAARLDALTVAQSDFPHRPWPPALAPPPPLPTATEEEFRGLFTMRECGPLLPALRRALRQGVVAPPLG